MLRLDPTVALRSSDGVMLAVLHTIENTTLGFDGHEQTCTTDELHPFHKNHWPVSLEVQVHGSLRDGLRFTQVVEGNFFFSEECLEDVWVLELCTYCGPLRH